MLGLYPAIFSSRYPKILGLAPPFLEFSGLVVELMVVVVGWKAVVMMVVLVG